MKYYIDTCIWIDFINDRKGHDGEPLGRYAGEFLTIVIEQSDTLIISDILLKELIDYDFMDMLSKFAKVQYVEHTLAQFEKAKILAQKFSIPLFDAMHATIAHDTEALLVSRDKHFDGVIGYRKPEDL